MKLTIGKGDDARTYPLPRKVSANLILRALDRFKTVDFDAAVYGLTQREKSAVLDILMAEESFHRSRVAQSEEPRTVNPVVDGSSPSPGASQGSEV
jgi:hypothetical protein